MDETWAAEGSAPATTFRIELTRDEVMLVQTALKLLESTLGHEEAEELDETQDLIARFSGQTV